MDGLERIGQHHENCCSRDDIHHIERINVVIFGDRFVSIYQSLGMVQQEVDQQVPPLCPPVFAMMSLVHGHSLLPRLVGAAGLANCNATCRVEARADGRWNGRLWGTHVATISAKSQLHKPEVPRCQEKHQLLPRWLSQLHGFALPLIFGLLAGM